MPLSILFVHQGHELYGSDRTLIQSVQASVARWPEARITVLLPRDGPLRKALAAVVDDVRIVNLAILRKSTLKSLRLRDAKKLFMKIGAARRMMLAYDVTYINTVVIMDYIVASCFVRGHRLVHVHEIPTGIAAFAFSLFLSISRGWLIFNSKATQRGFRIPVWQKEMVVWNGVAQKSQAIVRAPHPTLNVLLIGRFNSWKGHSVLVRALEQLPADLLAHVRVRLVGGVFGDQEHFVNEVIEVISESGLSATVAMFPFISDPSEHYAWADVVAVPSVKPEPFGLVAIEGMAAGCCIVASNHGGLSEIVIDGATGTLVPPGSAGSLANALGRYIKDPALAAAQGREGEKRFAAEFEQSRYNTRITDIIADLARVNAH